MALAPSHALTVGDVTVHEIDGLYSLNDLHRASGGEKRHAPNEWARTQQAQELAQEISKPGFPGLVVQKGGKAPGTYACRELVIAFAAWISAAFHLKVIRVFLAASLPQSQPTIDPERVKLAHALASHAMAHVAQTVFDAVMAGSDPELWKHNRYLLAFTYGRDNKASVPWAEALDPDQMVVSMDELPERLTGHEGFKATEAQLARLAGACAQRLEHQAEMREVDEAARKKAQTVTFTRAFKTASGWKDERKADALMQSMRLRKDVRLVGDPVPPARIVELHEQGHIGPRQFAKFKELML